MSHKKESKFVFYIGMILIIAGILYWDKYALNHF